MGIGLVRFVEDKNQFYDSLPTPYGSVILKKQEARVREHSSLSYAGSFSGLPVRTSHISHRISPGQPARCPGPVSSGGFLFRLEE